jgi:hypothetical protein
MDNDPTPEPTAQEIVSEYLEARKRRRVRLIDLTPRQQAGLVLSLSARLLASEPIRIDESFAVLDMFDSPTLGKTPWCDVLCAVLANVVAKDLDIELGETK